MTTLLAALQALAAQPAPRPDRPIFVAHPAHAEHPECLALLRGMQANGVDVRIMPSIHSPAIPLDLWLAPIPMSSLVRHNTFAELTTQAQRIVEECRREGKPLPKFAVTAEELDELLRANCWPDIPEGATFHGMVVTVVRP